tara:strand:- start:78 stop:470 length:393 start_codon:yes stop_codon:yes gene_type:complete
MTDGLQIVMENVSDLKHIEGFSLKRMLWLKNKILEEGIWNKPLSLDSKHCLVLDGQHRMEVALALGLRVVPVVKYDYSLVEIWSLREKYSFDWSDVETRALKGSIYPYKTVKHRFPGNVPLCHYPLEELY